MPYIKKEERPRYEPAIEELLHAFQEAETGFEGECIGNIRGHVVYVIFKLLKEMYAFDDKYTSADFETRTEALAILDATRLEFFERFLKDYEAKKREENGDV